MIHITTNHYAVEVPEGGARISRDLQLGDTDKYTVLGTVSKKGIDFDVSQIVQHREKPFVPHYAPYGMDESEFRFEVRQHEQQVARLHYENEQAFYSLLSSKGIEIKPDSKLLIIKKHSST